MSKPIVLSPYGDEIDDRLRRRRSHVRCVSGGPPTSSSTRERNAEGAALPEAPRKEQEKCDSQCVSH
jgi:hypothetical protein